MSESIDRAAWRLRTTTGEPLDCSVRVTSGGHVDVEPDGGMADDVSVYVREDAIDVRVGHLELVVAPDGRITLMQSHPPYPISRWTVLWEGTLSA